MNAAIRRHIEIPPLAWVLAEIARLLASEEGSDARVRRVLELLGHLVPYESCALLAGTSKEAPLFCVPEVGTTRSAALKLWLSGVLHLIKGNADAASPGSDPNRLVLPVIGADRIIGVLQVEHKAPYDLHHVQLLSAVSSQLGGYLHMVQLVTERKEAEEALRESESHLRAMIGQAAVGIALTDCEGRLLEVNQRLCQILGRGAEELLTLRCNDLTHPEDVPRKNAMIRELVRGTRTELAEEERYARGDGSWGWVKVAVTPIRDANNRVHRLLAVIEDINARKLAEQALREQEERLLKTEKIAAAGRLAASMAHEINNPLAAVTNVLYLLGSQSELDPSSHDLVKLGTSELARVSRIVKQSLSYYRLGIVPRDVDLGAVVNESLQIFSEKFQRGCIELKQNVRTGTVLLGFQDEIRQVIDNLILNALDAMPGAGHLTISVRESFDWSDTLRRGVRLTIGDSGCGIPKENRSKIFEPFFTTKAEKGTGLGLWVLRGIIAKHDGMMSLKSSDVKGRSGTVISVFWPSRARTLDRRKTGRSASPKVGA